MRLEEILADKGDTEAEPRPKVRRVLPKTPPGITLACNCGCGWRGHILGLAEKHAQDTGHVVGFTGEIRTVKA